VARQHRSSGPLDRTDPQLGGGYGRAPGEARGGFESGRNHAAEPGWGPGFGNPPPQDARLGQSAPPGDGTERSDAFRRQGVGWEGDTPAHDDRQREAPSSAASRRGRGPKGYERSDERLREDICERLIWNDDIDASEVSVEVRSGIVVLEGAVPERKMKHAIEDLADACLGVKEIENRIRVTYGEHHAVHADAKRAPSGARVSVGTPSGSGISGLSDVSSEGGAAPGGKSE